MHNDFLYIANRFELNELTLFYHMRHAHSNDYFLRNKKFTYFISLHSKHVSIKCCINYETYKSVCRLL